MTLLCWFKQWNSQAPDEFFIVIFSSFAFTLLFFFIWVSSFLKKVYEIEEHVIIESIFICCMIEEAFKAEKGFFFLFCFAFQMYIYLFVEDDFVVQSFVKFREIK